MRDRSHSQDQVALLHVVVRHTVLLLPSQYASKIDVLHQKRLLPPEESPTFTKAKRSAHLATSAPKNQDVS